MGQNIVHVIGTGTIGEPLIGLLAAHKEDFGIDEVTFYKHTPRRADTPKLKQLVKKGALLATQAEHIDAFKTQGLDAAFEAEEAMQRATVIIDCTPGGAGLTNKERNYRRLRDRVRGFIAQGSEFGFGKMYARGINDQILDRDQDQFLHVVSCNTHNISVLLRSLGNDGSGNVAIEDGRFLCLRRANDISQDGSFVPSPQVGSHSDARFGTHHARDAHALFETLGYDLNLFSSACKLNTQYMHALHFSVRVPFSITLDEVMHRFHENRRVALSEKRSANQIFSFGREHGHYGRILSQTVISTPTLLVRDHREITGFCFTPQDGNSLLSSIAAAMWYLDPDTVDDRLSCLRPYLFQEV